MKPIDACAAGVYRIRCIRNRKEYIGSAANICYRVGCHVMHLDKGRHPNIFLQASWDDFGKAAFRFEIVQIVDDAKQRLAYEKEVIQSMPVNRLFNMVWAEVSSQQKLARTKKRTAALQKRVDLSWVDDAEPMNFSNFISITEFAKMHNTSRGTAYGWLKAGVGPNHILSPVGTFYIEKDSARNWVRPTHRGDGGKVKR